MQRYDVLTDLVHIASFQYLKALVACKLNKSLAREAELDDLDSEICDEFKSYAE